MTVKAGLVRCERSARAGDLVITAGAAIAWAYLVALSAQLRVYLPFSPVPVTAQTLVVLLGGALLGARRGALAAALYLVGGAAGLPFFAGGTLAGPTGGYLIGFVLGAYVVGLLWEHWTKSDARRFVAAWLVFALGHGVIYVLGLVWLARFVGWPAALPLGLAPFVIGDLAKVVIAAAIVGWAMRGMDHTLDGSRVVHPTREEELS